MIIKIVTQILISVLLTMNILGSDHPRPVQVNAINTAAIPAPRTKPGIPTPFSKRAKAGNIDLVFLGDSNTHGWWLHKDLWQKYYGDMKAANFGAGGDRVQSLHWRILNGDADGYAARVVVLMVGTNNGNENTKAEIVEGISALLKSLRQKQPGAKILLMGIPPGNYKLGKYNTPRRTDIINSELAKLDDGATIRFYDLRTVLLDKEGNPLPGVFVDSLHFSRSGYELWAEAIHPLLLEMMGRSSLQKQSQGDVPREIMDRS
jgi:lysophospholipase L1-like esterase